MRCEGDATCQVIDQCAGARQAIGAETLFRRLRMLCVATVANVEVIVMALLIPIDIGPMVKIVVADVDVDVE